MVINLEYIKYIVLVVILIIIALAISNQERKTSNMKLIN